MLCSESSTRSRSATGCTCSVNQRSLRFMLAVVLAVYAALEPGQARPVRLQRPLRHQKNDLCSVRCTSMNFSSYSLRMRPFELPATLLCKQHEDGGDKASPYSMLLNRAPEQPAQFAVFKTARSGSTWFHSVLSKALASRGLTVMVGVYIFPR